MEQVERHVGQCSPVKLTVLLASLPGAKVSAYKVQSSVSFKWPLDESHQLLSAVLFAGLALQHSEETSGWSQWRERCQQLATRLEDPYGRMLLTWFMTKDWHETVQDVQVPLTER